MLSAMNTIVCVLVPTIVSDRQRVGVGAMVVATSKIIMFMRLVGSKRARTSAIGEVDNRSRRPVSVMISFGYVRHCISNR